MAGKHDVQDFYELRQGLLATTEFIEAALDFLNRNGIAMASSARTKSLREYSNGNGHKVNGKPTRDQMKQHFLSERGLKAARAEETTNAILAQLDTAEPRQVEGNRNSVKALVRRGVIVAKGTGYIRTAPLPEEQPDTPTEGDSAYTIEEAAKVLKMSGANVRLLIANKKIKAHKEPRLRGDRSKKPLPTMVIARDEVARYQAAAS